MQMAELKTVQLHCSARRTGTRQRRCEPARRETCSGFNTAQPYEFMFDFAVRVLEFVSFRNDFN